MKSNLKSHKIIHASPQKIFVVLANLLILSGLVYLLLLFYPIIYSELKYRFSSFGKETDSVKIETSSSTEHTTPELLPPLTVTPKSTDFGIIIEKIDLNTGVVKDVDITTKEGYWSVLEEQGVAHAKNTKYPGQYGNSYIFAHSTVSPLDISKYNAVFTLLNKLELGDRITTFFEGTRYDYIVDKIEIVEPTNLEPLTKQYEEPVITLQTCYPPGTSLKRLIVVAKIDAIVNSE